jgi:diacylglycerol O-acyltransferase-1
MILQHPLIQLTSRLGRMRTPHGRLLGNCIFWVSFTIFGQPLAALMYFYAWQAKYGSVSKTALGLDGAAAAAAAAGTCPVVASG